MAIVFILARLEVLRTLIKNGTIVNERLSCKGSLFIVGDSIADITDEPNDIECYEDQAEEVIDASGMYVIPGVIDCHVHFREPGAEQKATVASESAAAVLGGVTSFMDMPNNNPPACSVAAIAAKNEMAARDSYANYSFYLGATNSNFDEIKSVDPECTCGVKLFMGSSTGGMLVDDDSMLERIFSSSPVLVAVHCEDERMIRNNLECARQEYGDNVPISQHQFIRSREACIASTSRALELALRHGTRLHVMHVSTEEEVELIREARRRSTLITAETCPHYLCFCDEDYEKYGNLIKCNPAIKRRSDMLALRRAVVDGTVSEVSTDHAPHLIDEKMKPYLQAPSGIPSVQFSLLYMMSLFERGVISIEDIVELMCHGPARCFNIEDRGFLKLGYSADIAVVSPDRPFEGPVASKCGWSPVTQFSSSVVHTFVNGEHVVDDGELTGKRYVSKLRFAR